jgi:hypothetical protein
MFSRTPIRLGLGAVLGACAGVSLVLSVLPVALPLAGFGDQLFLVRALSGAALPAALVWAVGGVAAARLGRPLPGAVALGLVGLLSAALLSGLVLAFQPALVAAAGAAGLVYGFVGGMILGRVLAPPAAGE